MVTGVFMFWGDGGAAGPDSARTAHGQRTDSTQGCLLSKINRNGVAAHPRTQGRRPRGTGFRAPLYLCLSLHTGLRLMAQRRGAAGSDPQSLVTSGYAGLGRAHVSRLDGVAPDCRLREGDRPPSFF